MTDEKQAKEKRKMARLTERDENGDVTPVEFERVCKAVGYVDKDTMMKITMHLAEKLAEYEDEQEKIPYECMPGIIRKQIEELNRLADDVVECHSKQPPYVMDLAEVSILRDAADTIEKLCKQKICVINLNRLKAGKEIHGKGR